MDEAELRIAELKSLSRARYDSLFQLVRRVTHIQDEMMAEDAFVFALERALMYYDGSTLLETYLVKVVKHYALRNYDFDYRYPERLTSEVDMRSGDSGEDSGLDAIPDTRYAPSNPIEFELANKVLEVLENESVSDQLSWETINQWGGRQIMALRAQEIANVFLKAAKANDGLGVREYDERTSTGRQARVEINAGLARQLHLGIPTIERVMTFLREVTSQISNESLGRGNVL